MNQNNRKQHWFYNQKNYVSEVNWIKIIIDSSVYDGVGFTVVTEEESHIEKLSRQSSMFIAELDNIQAALKLNKQTLKN